MTNAVTHLVFDLGGVIVKLRGTPVPLKWFPVSDKPDDVWQRWLTSDAPRLFEAGKIAPKEFSEQLVQELSLSVTAEQFLEYFRDLPECVFDGALPLLVEVKQRYTTACYSNSNELHWHGKMIEMGLAPYFDHHFASHLMGIVKPDVEGFHFIADALNVDASNILFLDDNQLNVDAAQAAGWQALRVVGVDELQQALSLL